MKIKKKLTISFVFAMFFCLFCVSSLSAQTHKESLQEADSALKAAKVIKTGWYPSFHVAAPALGMKNPNAFTGFGDSYHLFYQQDIKKTDKQIAVWGHYSTQDLINWKRLPSALAPSELYDKDSLYGGSAIEDDGLLYLIYTGCVENKKNDKIEKRETQNLAMSKDGINFGKSANNSVIKTAPHYSYLEFSSQNFTDPYVWKLEDRYYALVGAQYEKTKDGAVILFKSKDLRNWVCINVSAIGQKGEMGYMWESPSLIHINGNDVLNISAQGIKPHGKMFLNKFQSGAFVGKLDYTTGKFSQKGAFMLYDYGFDFYAPQFTKTADNRHIFIAWLSMDGTPMFEETENWSGMMTLPRELKVVDGKIHTFPVKELEALRDEKITVHPQSFSNQKEFFNVKGDIYEIDSCFDLTNAKNLVLKLRTSASQETVLSYDKDTKLLKLNRDKSSVSVSGKSINGEREVVLPLTDNKLKLRIFVDKSSVEVFANDGLAAMSSRIYPDKNSVGIKLISTGETKIEKFDFYKLKSIKN